MPDQPSRSSVRPPGVGKAVAPAALLMAVAGLAYLGLAEIGSGHGAFARSVYEPYYDPASIPKESGEVDWFGDGKIVYANNCAACHMANGAGNPANGCPPLAGADWVNAAGPNRLARLVLHGAAGPIIVNGQTWNGVMPPWKDVLSDDQIAAVLTYIRAEWGNTAAPVTPEQVKVVRDAESARSAPWSAAELLKIPES